MTTKRKIGVLGCAAAISILCALAIASTSDCYESCKNALDRCTQNASRNGTSSQGCYTAYDNCTRACQNGEPNRAPASTPHR
jgi:hypothetical protein